MKPVKCTLFFPFLHFFFNVHFVFSYLRLPESTFLQSPMTVVAEEPPSKRKCDSYPGGHEGMLQSCKMPPSLKKNLSESLVWSSTFPSTEAFLTVHSGRLPSVKRYPIQPFAVCSVCDQI